MNEDIKQYILDRIKVDENGCWIWQPYKDDDGYGAACVNYKKWYAHRLSYTAFVGEITKGKLVCHSCDVPSCCNPEHLWIGSYQDNINDCIAKGRRRYHGSRGEEHINAKLTKSDVLRIRTDTRTYKKIANDFNISIGHVNNIKKKRMWGWLK